MKIAGFPLSSQLFLFAARAHRLHQSKAKQCKPKTKNQKPMALTISLMDCVTEAPPTGAGVFHYIHFIHRIPWACINKMVAVGQQSKQPHRRSLQHLNTWIWISSQAIWITAVW